MIGRLRGVIIERIPPQLLLDVQGVGYEIELPLSMFAELPAEGDVILYTHLVVRDDAHLLYGFLTINRRAWFRMLLKVNGIGPRVALALLSSLSDEELWRCVQEGDVARLTRAPGIGRKTAERLLIELRGRMPEPGGMGPSQSGEAVGALLTLGYNEREAQAAVDRAAKELGKTATSEALIREALRGMIR
ncbi:MAG TPA: Holliday junction branch migration protein RuvA [Acidiferrobacter sp.]|nr:Holliday junction branch migration protein RuvA [Acidiferrobacter sp.]